MRKITLIGLIAVFILIIPLIAYSEETEGLEDTLAARLEFAAELGLTAIDTDIDEVFSEPDTYEFDLEAGNYVIVAEPDSNIGDLDLYGYFIDEYEADGDPFIEDSGSDNVPVLEFTLDEPGTIVVKVVAFEFALDDEGNAFESGEYFIMFLTDVSEE